MGKLLVRGGLALGFGYTALWLVLSVLALWAEGNAITIHFNQFGEIWADIIFFGAGTIGMGYAIKKRGMN